MSSANKKSWARWLPKLVIVIALGVTIGLFFMLKNWIDSSETTTPKKTHIVKIFSPPPPPPPPPEEEPPEPEVEEELEEPEDEIADEIPEESEPAGADLGVDSDGGAGIDGFGLIGRKGGRGLLDGSPFAYYEGLMVSEIQDVLAEIDDLKSDEYKFRIKITVRFDGTVESVKLIKSTGNKDKDRKLLSALMQFKKFSQMPPGKMPPVVDLRIISSI